MQILELQIKNFGKFSNETIRFHKGINILYGQNEMGKSTIHSFIKGMFFGIEKQRGRAAKNDEYSLRQPWDNPGYFAGALRFESGGKIFRIERNFEKRDKSVYFLCETDGEELSVEDGDLEILMEGLNEASFRNTIFVPQKNSVTDEGLANEVQRFMSNQENAGDSEIDVGIALKSLDEKRRQLEHRKKEKQSKISERLKEVQIKLDYNSRELTELRSSIEHGQIRLKGLLGQKEKARAERAERLSQGRKQQALLLLPGIAAAVAGIFVRAVWIRIAMWLGGLLLLGLFVRSLKDSRTDDMEDEQIPYQKQEWDLERLQIEWREKNTIQENLLESLEEIQEDARQTDEIDEEIQAIQLAKDCIKEASEGFYKRMERQLNIRVGEILCALTDGKYTSVFIDSDLQVKINTEAKLLTLNQVSRGTMEQIYFALRMAVGEMLCKKEPMPVILDEAFAMYDDQRLERTMKWLKESGRQVILFTCHKREQEILRKGKHTGADGTT